MTKFPRADDMAPGLGAFLLNDVTAPSIGSGLRPGMFGQRLFRLNQIAGAARDQFSAPAGSVASTAARNGRASAAIAPGVAGMFSDLAPQDGSSADSTFTYTDPLKACYGFARGLAGNTKLYGKKGAFDIVRPNSAAIIPYQFDRSRKAALTPYVKQISGQLTSSDGSRSSWFRGITDVIDGKSPGHTGKGRTATSLPRTANHRSAGRPGCRQRRAGRAQKLPLRVAMPNRNGALEGVGA